MAEASKASTTSVKLKVKDFKRDRDVCEVNYSFYQSTDKEGQPTGIPRGGRITIVVKAGTDGNNELFNWMIQKSLAYDGIIEFMDPTNISKKMKEIKFKQAYCVEFNENWRDEMWLTAKDLVAHTEKITISCKEISIEAATFENEWA
jgi:hypothetical protein